MTNALVRLAVAQITFVVYAVLGIGVILRLRYGSPAPADLFATYLRDYGFLLMLGPAAWCVWAVFHASKEFVDGETRDALFASGLALAGILAAIAFFGTMSALVHDTLLVTKPAPNGVVRPSGEP